jgi:hypothetical protein
MNGAGKSTIVRKFFARWPYQEIYGSLGTRRPEAYRVRMPMRNIFVIGSYHAGATTGGVDQIHKVEDTIFLLDKYHAKGGHVLFEGAMISTYYGAIGEWLVAHKDEAIAAYLSTPGEDCVAGLRSRNGGKAMSRARPEVRMPEVTRTLERLKADGLRVETITREDGFDKIVGWFK